MLALGASNLALDHASVPWIRRYRATYPAISGDGRRRPPSCWRGCANWHTLRFAGLHSLRELADAGKREDALEQLGDGRVDRLSDHVDRLHVGVSATPE